MTASKKRAEQSRLLKLDSLLTDISLIGILFGAIPWLIVVSLWASGSLAFEGDIFITAITTAAGALFFGAIITLIYRESVRHELRKNAHYSHRRNIKHLILQ